MSGNPPPKRPKVTDEELLEAVEHAYGTYRDPVVKSEDVADVEFIDVQQQTVKRRLDTLREEGEVGALKIGRGWVWWPIDEEGEPAEETDIHWDVIEPEQIPDEMVEEHPAYPDPGLPDRVVDSGQTILFGALVVTVFGMVLFLPSQYGLDYIPIPQSLETTGAIATLGGLVFIAVGIVLVLAGEFLARLGYE